MGGMACRWQHVPHLVARAFTCHSNNFNRTSQHVFRRSSSSVSKSHKSNGIFQISEEVADALHSGKPVVALESTIITHGMPNPENVKTALDVEEIVRDNGSIPCTVAVMKGKIHVGMSCEQLEWLGSQRDGLVKISRRDFPYVLSQHLSGGTTVSGTMLVAHKMGIPIFVTGGIGGVHRGAETSMDISADLTELGRTPVAVISAGVKSILDIGWTLEYLETQGVCMATYGSSYDFPAFFTSRSGFLSPYHVETPSSAADLIDSNIKVNSGSGIIIAVPIPESFSASGEIIESAIQTSIQEASDQGVTGKAVTPFILSRVNDITGGASLQANIALIKNNAAVGSKIAKELTEVRYRHDDRKKTSHSTVTTRARNTSTSSARPVVVGGTIVDFYVHLGQGDVQSNGATYKGSLKQSFGGVGRNVADCLSRLGSQPLLVSAVGKGSHTGALHAYCQHMDLSGVTELEGLSTAAYCGVLQQSGEMMFGVGDMDIHSHITPQLVSRFTERLIQAPLVCSDGNITQETMEYLFDMCHQNSVPVWFEPADQYKAVKPYSTSARYNMTYTSPNVAELMQMWSASKGKPCTDDPIALESAGVGDVIDACLPCCYDLVDTIPVLIVTLGCHGVLLCHRLGAKPVFPTKHHQIYSDKVTVLHYPACSPAQMPSSTLSVSGAGDCLAAGMMNAIIQGHDLDLCVKAGLMAAQFSLQSHHAVPPSITVDHFTVNKVKDWASWTPTTIRG